MSADGLISRARGQLQALQSDLHKATNAYSVGDRSKHTITTLASAKVLADTLGVRLPVPHGTSLVAWNCVLSGLVDRFSGRVNNRGKDYGTPTH